MEWTRVGDSIREPAIYRPFALLSLTAALGGGIPLGIWMLGWLYLGATAVPMEWIQLHAHVQIFGFFGTLIMGVAPHLLARFTGRPVSQSRIVGWLLGLQTAGLALRIVGTAVARPVLVLVASALEAVAFLLLAGRVWRMLDPRPLASLRWQLTASSAWLGGACALEVWLRVDTLGSGLPLPGVAGLRIVQAMGLFGGVLGWVLGVLLRAGPMFVPRWRTPARVARALPGLLALGVTVTASGAARAWSVDTARLLTALGECIVLSVAVGLLWLGGALAPGGGTLPMAARSPLEARIFRVAMLSAGGAVVGSGAAVAAAWARIEVPLLSDAVRHLLTVGVLTSVVVAMLFRLIPVLEGRALPWPRLRHVALWSLAAGIVLRSAEVLIGLGWLALAPWIPLSGLLIWVAIACVAINLVAVIGTGARTTMNPA